MKRGMNRMRCDHPGDQPFDALNSGGVFVGNPKHREHIVKMTPQDRLDQRQLVGKVLVQRSDAHAGCFGHRIGGESRPALTVENASSGLQYGFDGHLCARLAR